MNTSLAATRSHTSHCAWFWAWAVAGAVFALGLDVVLLLPLAGLLAWPLARSDRARPSAWGAMTGAGLPFLYVAYLQSAPGGLSPWPWLGIGATLVTVGLVADHQSRRPA
jgi:hypothetical protein